MITFPITYFKNKSDCEERPKISTTVNNHSLEREVKSFSFKFFFKLPEFLNVNKINCKSSKFNTLNYT